MTPEVRVSLTFVGFLEYIDRGFLAGMKLLVKGEEKGEYMWNQTPIQTDYSEAFVSPEEKEPANQVQEGRSEGEFRGRGHGGCFRRDFREDFKARR